MTLFFHHKQEYIGDVKRECKIWYLKKKSRINACICIYKYFGKVHFTNKAHFNDMSVNWYGMIQSISTVYVKLSHIHSYISTLFIFCCLFLTLFNFFFGICCKKPLYIMRTSCHQKAREKILNELQFFSHKKTIYTYTLLGCYVN